MPDSYDRFAGVVSDGSEVEIAAFKRVFLSDDGQFVLQRILEKCKFMEPCENERDMALNNFAKDLIGIVYWDDRRKAVKMYEVLNFIRNKLKRRKNA